MNKETTLTAVLPLVQDGQTLALGGMTLYRRPVAFAHTLIQQLVRPQNLTLLAFTAGLASDMLVGAGMIDRTRTCYFGLETFGLAPMFTQAVTEDNIQIIEESEASLACGLRAQMGKLGFMPSRAWQGTDMFQARPDVKTVVDPYTGETLTAFPAIACDVAVIHVLEADRRGNCRLGGNPTVDKELAMVADTVIITAESILDQLEPPVDIPGVMVTAVVHQPRGAWPTSCYPQYPLDGQAILDYIQACHQGQFEQFMASRQI